MIILNCILFVLVMILTFIYCYNSKLLIVAADRVASDKLCKDIIKELPFTLKAFEITKSISKEKVWETRSLKIRLYGETVIGHKILRISTNIPIRDLISEEKIIQEAEYLMEHFVNNVNIKAIKPLDRIIKSSGLLMQITNNTEVPELVKTTIRDSNTTMTLFENIIVSANLQVNKIQNNHERVDCVKLLEDTRIKYIEKIQTHQKDIELILDQPYSASIIYPERNKLMLVLDNYLNNAIEYTTKGTIHFGLVHTDDNQVLFYVQDTGSGISRAKQTDLFDNNKLTDDKNHVGSGLGLNICKQIALNSKGAYGVVSEENEGSIFWMSLPLKFEYTEIIDYDWTSIKRILKEIQA